MADIETIGPLGLRRFTLGAPCQENQGHTHNYDHVTFVQRGSIKVFSGTSPDGPEIESGTYVAGDMILIKADVYHRIKALETGTRYACTFLHRDHDGIPIQEYSGNDEAYI